MCGCERWTIKKTEHWRIDAFECDVGEDSSESLRLQGVSPNRNQSWIFIGRTDGWSWRSNTLVTWCEELSHWKRPWCWERLRAGEEGDDRGWDGGMASPTWWTWVWEVGDRQGSLAVLQSMGSQRVGNDWATELTDWYPGFKTFYFYNIFFFEDFTYVRK